MIADKASVIEGLPGMEHLISTILREQGKWHVKLTRSIHTETHFKKIKN